MNCSKCGAVLNPGDIMCSNCGNPVQNIPVQVVPSGNGGVNPNINTGNMPAQGNVVQTVPVAAQNNVVQPVPNPLQNSNSNPNPMNDKNKLLVFGIAGLGILIIIIGIVLGVTSDKKEDNKENNNKPEPVETVKYSYLDYELPYLESYIKEVNDEGLSLLDEQNNIRVLLSFIDNNMSGVEDALPSIKSSLTKNGFTFRDEENKTISNVSWHLINADLELNEDKYPGVLAFTSMRENVVLFVQIFNLSGTDKNYDNILLNLSKMVLESNYHGIDNAEDNDTDTKSKTIIIPDFRNLLTSNSSTNVG